MLRVLVVHLRSELLQKIVILLRRLAEFALLATPAEGARGAGLARIRVLHRLAPPPSSDAEPLSPKMEASDSSLRTLHALVAPPPPRDDEAAASSTP